MNKEMTEFSHYFLVNIKFASLLLRINRVLFLFGIGEEDALLLTFFVHPQTEMSSAPPLDHLSSRKQETNKGEINRR